MVTRTKKIFVGGLSANTVVEDVKQYFEQFGKVSSCPSEHYIFRILPSFFSFLFKVCLEKQKCSESCARRRATIFAFQCNFSKPLEFLFCLFLVCVCVYNIANIVYFH